MFYSDLFITFYSNRRIWNKMLGRSSIKKILKKYKNKNIRDLSSDERTEVLKLMDQSFEKGAINLFVRKKGEELFNKSELVAVTHGDFFYVIKNIA